MMIIIGGALARNMAGYLIIWLARRGDSVMIHIPGYHFNPDLAL